MLPGCDEGTAVRRVIIAGFGPHFRDIYLGILLREGTQHRVVLVIDLESQEREVRDLCGRLSLSPEAFLFVPDAWRRSIPHERLWTALDQKQSEVRADAIVISTEPKAHFAYASWACRNNLSVFMDKPITAFDSPAEKHRLLSDYDDLLRLRRHSCRPFYVSCERRAHVGYRHIFAFLENLIARTRIPVTHVSVHFGAGKRITFEEAQQAENHPFKYGYGILLHSGYHYIDLIARFMALNVGLWGGELGSPVVYSVFNRGLPSSSDERPRREVRSDIVPGEVDVVGGGFYEFGGERSTFSIELIGRSVSARASPLTFGSGSFPPGRMRQEYVVVHLANACSVTVSSVSFDKVGFKEDDSDFSIRIARNGSLTGENGVVSVRRGDLTRRYPECPAVGSLNQWARASMFGSFLRGDGPEFDIGTHRDTVVLLQALYDAEG